MDISNETSTVEDVSPSVQSSHPIGGPEYLLNFPHLAYPYLLIAGCASVFGTLGNVLVLCSVGLSKSLHHHRNVFLVNLAIADLCVTSFADPLGILGMVKGKDYFEARPALCDIAATVCLTACVTALFSIGGISFNRYLNICHSNIYEKVFSLRNNILMCVGFWFVGIVMSLPGLVGWTDNVYDHKMLECIWDRLHSLSYTIFFSAGVVFTPVCVITFSYLGIFLHVRSSRRRVEAVIKSKEVASVTSASVPNATSKSVSSSLKLARSLFIIFMIFVGCWSPYAILVLIDWGDNFPHEVHLYILLLAHMHASLNPLVYGATNAHFKTAYKRIIWGPCGKTFVDEMTHLSRSNADDNRLHVPK